MAGRIENLKKSERTELTYTQKVAAAMTWWRRCLLGLMAQLHFQGGYFIMGHPEFMEMSQARKLKLRDIYKARVEAREAVERLLVEIENFQKLPITLEDERQGRYSRHQKTFKPRTSRPATME